MFAVAEAIVSDNSARSAISEEASPLVQCVHELWQNRPVKMGRYAVTPVRVCPSTHGKEMLLAASFDPYKRSSKYLVMFPQVEDVERYRAASAASADRYGPGDLFSGGIGVLCFTVSLYKWQYFTMVRYVQGTVNFENLSAKCLRNEVSAGSVIDKKAARAYAGWRQNIFLGLIGRCLEDNAVPSSREMPHFLTINDREYQSIPEKLRPLFKADHVTEGSLLQHNIRVDGWRERILAASQSQSGN